MMLFIITITMMALLYILSYIRAYNRSDYFSQQCAKLIKPTCKKKNIFASISKLEEDINEFAKIGAESFPNIPYEELYDLENDPYQKVNLITEPKYKKIRNRLSVALESWMKSQEDFLLDDPISVLKPTLHPLDKISKWNNVPNDLIGKLKDEDYVKLHY